MPYFSIVIPTYNRSGLLQETLDSVFSQDQSDFEVIVVDDGSIDETLNLIAAYGSRVRLFKQENRGPGAARNVGIQHASGVYVAFLDSDDLWFSWTLSTYAEVIKRTNNPAFVAGRPRCFSSVQEIADARQAEPDYREFPDYYSSGDEWRWWGASSFVIRRDVLISAGGCTDERINGEDADLALRLGVAFGFVQITAPETFGYRKHLGSVMHNLDLTIEGIEMQLKAEQDCNYPGGRSRANERHQILTRQVRSLSLDCIKNGRHGDGWRLYFATLRWHIELFRWRYLLGFPLRALLTRK